MRKKIVAIISTIALLVTSGPAMAVQGKSMELESLPVKQISAIGNNALTNGSAKAAENLTSLAINDEIFYDRLADGGIKPQSAIKKVDGTNITLNMEEVTDIEINFWRKDMQSLRVEMTDANRLILESLLSGCTGLKRLNLSYGKLGEVDFSGLSGRNSLTAMYLFDCKISSVPDLSLPGLTTLGLSKNTLSYESISKNLTKSKLPNLTALYLDACGLSDTSFIDNAGALQTLSLGDNKLTDASIDTLLATANNDIKSSLKELKLGLMVHITASHSEGTGGIGSRNNFTNLDKLASLPTSFGGLTDLNLSGLKITSLEKFKDVRSDIKIDFTWNHITDFTGLEGKTNFLIGHQRITSSDSFAKGWESELPENITELIQKILDENSIVHGELQYENCSLSNDYKKIVIEADARDACIEVNTGKLDSSIISFSLLELTAPEIPENLTAVVGDKLSQIVLPEGFEWKDSSLDVGPEGINKFQAGYTKQYNGKNYYLDIDVPVTVKLSTADNDPETPTPTPELPTPAPETPTPTPKVPTPSPLPQPPIPQQPTPMPTTPSPKPATPIPQQPTPIPQQPTPVPTAPTSEPATPTPIPDTPTPVSTQKPDESNLTGNQIEKRTDLPILLAVGKQKGKNSIRLTWNKKSGCTGYEVYWSFCDGKQNFKKLKTIKSNGKRVCIHTKLKKTRAYKYYIATYKEENGRKNYISKSSVIHVAMKKEKHTNVKKIKLNKTELALKPNKSFKIKATAVAEEKKKPLLNHGPKFRYYTDNKEIAAVTKKGVVKAKKKGTCTIYVIANNGVSKTLKVTVK